VHMCRVNKSTKSNFYIILKEFVDLGL